MNFDPDPERDNDWQANSPFAPKTPEALIAEREERERLSAIAEAVRIAAWQAEPGCEGYRIFRFDIALQASHGLAPIEDDYGAETIEGTQGFELWDQAIAAAAKVELAPLFAPFLEYFASIGCIRGDATMQGFAGDIPAEADEEDHLPTVYLIARVDGDDVLDPATLLPEQILSATPTFVAVTLRPDYTPDGSITGLFEQLRARQPDANIGQWGGAGTPDLLPATTEVLADWLDRVAVPANRLRRTISRWERSKSIELFQMCGSSTERVGGGQAIGWAVPGLIPTGCVTLLVGTRMAGKSTLVGELAAVLDSEFEGPRNFLGVEVTARLVVATVSGEDAESVIDARALYYEEEHGEAQGFVIDGIAKSFDDCLKVLHSIPELGLVIFDPVRKFLVGDEDSSSSASLYFDRMTELANKTGCAVIAVHHLKKGGVPRALSQLAAQVRGSAVFMDRPRMVVGMLDRGNSITEIGILKHNFPPSQRLWGALNEGRQFRRDADSMRLVPYDAAHPKPADKGEPIDDVAERILSAVASQCVIGKTVRPTGRCELFELKLPELAGLSRGSIRAAIAGLIADGRIINGDDGLKVGAHEGGCRSPDLT